MTANGASDGKPADEIIEDAHLELHDEAKSASAVVDKILDAAANNTQLQLDEAEKKAASSVLDFVPPNARKDGEKFIEDLQTDARPQITAFLAKAFHAARAWIDNFAASVEARL